MAKRKPPRSGQDRQNAPRGLLSERRTNGRCQNRSPCRVPPRSRPNASPMGCCPMRVLALHGLGKAHGEAQVAAQRARSPKRPERPSLGKADKWPLPKPSALARTASQSPQCFADGLLPPGTSARAARRYGSLRPPDRCAKPSIYTHPTPLSARVQVSLRASRLAYMPERPGMGRRNALLLRNAARGLSFHDAIPYPTVRVHSADDVATGAQSGDALSNLRRHPTPCAQSAVCLFRLWRGGLFPAAKLMPPANPPRIPGAAGGDGPAIARKALRGRVVHRRL